MDCRHRDGLSGTKGVTPDELIQAFQRRGMLPQASVAEQLKKKLDEKNKGKSKTVTRSVGFEEFGEALAEETLRRLKPNLQSLGRQAAAVASKVARTRLEGLMPAIEAAAMKSAKPQIPGLIKAFEAQTPKLIAAALPPAQEWADRRLVKNVVKPILDREIAKVKFKAKYGISRAAAGTGSILVLSAIAYLIISKAKRRRSKQP